MEPLDRITKLNLSPQLIYVTLFKLGMITGKYTLRISPNPNSPKVLDPHEATLPLSKKI